MSEPPSWLSDTAQANAKPLAKVAVSNLAKAPPPPTYQPPTPPNAGDVETGAAAPVPTDFDVDPVVLKEMGNYLFALRVLYMSCAAFLGLAAGLSLVGQTDLGLIFFAFYVLFFSLLICCFELGWSIIAQYIANNFGFMYTLSGRWAFLLFVGFMTFSLGVLGIVAMCWLYAVGLVHVYIMFKYPKFEQFVRRKHYYEGKK